MKSYVIKAEWYGTGRGGALRAFHRIVDDGNGNDTADFLFMPVNDASATDLNHRGSRWSLLLVDRRSQRSRSLPLRLLQGAQ